MVVLDFLIGLVSGFFWVLVGGGIPLLVLKYYDWRDEHFLNNKIGSWASKYQNKTVEFLFDPHQHYPIQEMEAFFNEIYTFNSAWKENALYNVGKWLFPVNFNIVGGGGKVRFFMTMESDLMQIALSHLQTHYPNLRLQEVSNPFEGWSQKWDPETGSLGLTNFAGGEMMPKKSDLFGLRSYETFYKDGVIVSDPISTLYSYLSQAPKEAYIIVQVLTRSNPRSQASNTPRWNKELQALRNEFVRNSAVERTGTMVQALTTQENQILNAAQKKIDSVQYQVKLRWGVLFSNESGVSDGGVKKGVYSWLNELRTTTQKLSDDDATETGLNYDGRFPGLLENFLQSYWEKVWVRGSEKKYRIKKLYESILDQSITTGNGPFHLDTHSLASLIHLPETKLSIQPKANQLAFGYPENSQTNPNQPYPNSDPNQQRVVIQQVNPRFYIQDNPNQNFDSKQSYPSQTINSNSYPSQPELPNQPNQNPASQLASQPLNQQTSNPYNQNWNQYPANQTNNTANNFYPQASSNQTNSLPNPTENSTANQNQTQAYNLQNNQNQNQTQIPIHNSNQDQPNNLPNPNLNQTSPDSNRPIANPNNSLVHNILNSNQGKAQKIEQVTPPEDLPF